MKALIFENKVVQIESEEFDVSPSLEWVNLAGVAPIPKVGWDFDGTAFNAPPPLPTPRPPPLSGDDVWTELETRGIVPPGSRPTGARPP